SQVPLIASRISMVSAVRTERALERATSKQERIEEGLSGEKARKSVTVCSFASLWTERKAALQPAVETADSHSLVVAPLAVGSLPPCGGGLGRGVVVCGTCGATTPDPHPQPSPAGGRGVAAAYVALI